MAAKMIINISKNFTGIPVLDTADTRRWFRHGCVQGNNRSDIIQYKIAVEFWQQTNMGSLSLYVS